MKLKLLDLLFFFLTVFLGFFFFRIVQGNNLLEEKIQDQGLQARVLREEIGQVKEENHVLFQKFVQPKQEELKQNKVPRPRPVLTVPFNSQKNVNVLLLGHHQRLADSILVLSVQAQKIILFSIPRDLFVKGRKINEYLSLYGVEALKEKVEFVTGLFIEKYAVFNFQAFEKLIDALGGVDIYVEKAIYDGFYPDGQGGYTVYSLGVGSHHLNGKETLKYTRSRHSTSDFDRARRLQQVLKALHERVINFNFSKNLDSLRTIYESLESNVETNVSLLEILAYFEALQHFTIDAGHIISPENVLYATTNILGQYILLPKGGGFEKVHTYIRQKM